ncbi:lysylphosphatidylglycerol synthase transmembrane domain-containing protein [Gloeothece verrucosa]|uniref:Uncharacterized protein n=1 Tax=Gloeothece verrucosa (strain PCC 7822) TaxID=497965 RepID=E0UDF1_GLOV7|nr:YbhN family protein [Gloeothece verrucosa]ADN14142.1 conserved hypothetical protein [Gloeothece verrucosa PCC 7822]
MKAIKPYLRWLIFGGTLFFILKTLKDHWQQVASVRLETQGWWLLILAAMITFFAHTWSGWVWTWILKIFKQPVNPRWAVCVYLKTNLAKYLPGNVWHFYGRISAVHKVGGSLEAASVSVLLEPVLMAAAALSIAVVSSGLGLIKSQGNNPILLCEFLALIAVLLGIHPYILNPLMKRLSRLKNPGHSISSVQIDSYPLLPLLGEIGFLGFRGIGFIVTLMALMTVNPIYLPQLISVFSLAWLLGLIVPGAPGGLGVFEATMIALLNRQDFPVAIILSAVALYRLISILAEVAGAGFGSFSQIQVSKTP